MPDVLLADLDSLRSPLPFVDAHGNTVSVSDGRIYLNARRITRTAALDLSCALVRAVNDTHQTRTKEARHA